jgi:hypothetical protein
MRSPQSRGTNKEIIMFDTHEFVSTLKTAGATEQQATIVLRAVSKALDTEREGLVTKDALNDLKLYIGTQFAELKTEHSTQFAELKAEHSLEIRNLKFMTATTLSIALVAVGKYLFT